MPFTREQMNEVGNVDVVMKKRCILQTFIKTSVDSVSSGILDKLSKNLGLLGKEVYSIKTDMQTLNVDHQDDIKTLDKLDLLEKNILESPNNW
ncbi:hypothetical protein JTB14_002154 [Gonioctena quinquepunctata]|nr:hypothetical protein JTB14_002154 [Gonioctena quinquepunctata]